jgi:hypothetical protein
MDEVLLMNALEALHHFNHDLGGVFEREGLTRYLGLVGEKIPCLAVLHDNDDEVTGWLREDILVYSYSYLTMLGWLSFFMMSISWSMYF